MSSRPGSLGNKANRNDRQKGLATARSLQTTSGIRQISCSLCDAPIAVPGLGQSTRRFCSRSCSGKWRKSTEGRARRKAYRQQMMAKRYRKQDEKHIFNSPFRRNNES